MEDRNFFLLDGRCDWDAILAVKNLVNNKGTCIKAFIKPIVVFLNIEKRENLLGINLWIFNPNREYQKEEKEELTRELELNFLFGKILLRTQPVNWSDLEALGKTTLPFIPQLVNLIEDGIKRVEISKAEDFWEFCFENRENAFEIEAGGKREKVRYPFSPAAVFENDERSVVVSRIPLGDNYLVSIFPEGVNIGLRRYGEGFIPTCVNQV